MAAEPLERATSMIDCAETGVPFSKIAFIEKTFWLPGTGGGASAAGTSCEDGMLGAASAHESEMIESKRTSATAKNRMD